MGLLDTVLANDAAFLADIDEFGESISYIKRDGTTRAIVGIVVRNVLRRIAGAPTPQPISPWIEVTVRNDATYGISTAEIDCGADAISLPRRIGESAATLQLVSIIHQDHGMVTIKLG